MSASHHSQLLALKSVCDAIIEAVSVAGTLGAPGGIHHRSESGRLNRNPPSRARRVIRASITMKLLWKFKPAPFLTLDTIEETLAYLANPPKLDGMQMWAVCSIPLCDFMDEMEKDGYVYNTQAQRAFEKAHGLEEKPENGSEMSRLVYNAQAYRRARKMELEGWEPCTREMLSEALRLKKRVQVRGEGMLGNEVQESFAVRIWNGNGLPCAFRDKKRNPFGVVGMPCKLVAEAPSPVSEPRAVGTETLVLA